MAEGRQVALWGTDQMAWVSSVNARRGRDRVQPGRMQLTPGVAAQPSRDGVQLGCVGRSRPVPRQGSLEFTLRSDPGIAEHRRAWRDGTGGGRDGGRSYVTVGSSRASPTIRRSDTSRWHPRRTSAQCATGVRSGLPTRPRISTYRWHVHRRQVFGLAGAHRRLRRSYWPSLPRSVDPVGLQKSASPVTCGD